jgi:hypothetical protein
MLGRTVDNNHPYGIRVAPSGPATPAVAQAIAEASKDVDKVIAQLNGPKRNGRSRRRRTAGAA